MSHPLPTPEHDLTTTTVVLERPRRGRLRSLLALGGALGLGLVGTSAAFSDTATVTAELSAGTLDIEVDGEQGNPVPHPLTIPGADAIAPGQVLHAPLVVTNVGTVGAELSMAVSSNPDGSTDNATDELRLTVAAAGAGGTCDAGVVSADSSPHVSDAPLGAAAFGGVALAGGGELELCLAVELPSSVTGTGGGSTQVDLLFIADQALA